MGNFNLWLEDRVPFYKRHEILKKYENQNAFVSFTSLPKLGLNPKSEHNTPLGIYAYPVEYVLENIVGAGHTFNVPFAGESPYIWLFKPTGNIIHITYLKESPLSDLIKPLWNSEEEYKKDIKKLYEGKLTYNGEVLKLKSKGSLPFVMLLYKSETPAEFNKNCRKLNISGFVDHGTGTIHENEPIQAVFFDVSKLIIMPESPIENKTKFKRTDKKTTFPNLLNKALNKVFNYSPFNPHPVNELLQPLPDWFYENLDFATKLLSQIKNPIQLYELPHIVFEPFLKKPDNWTKRDEPKIKNFLNLYYDLVDKGMLYE